MGDGPLRDSATADEPFRSAAAATADEPFDLGPRGNDIASGGSLWQQPPNPIGGEGGEFELKRLRDVIEKKAMTTTAMTTTRDDLDDYGGDGEGGRGSTD